MSISPDRALRALLVLLGAALFAFGAAACGSDDDGGGDVNGTYLRDLNRAQRDYASDARRLNLAKPASPKAFKGALDRLVVLLGTLEQRFEGINPPDVVDAQHDRLIAELDHYGEVIRRQKGGLTSERKRQIETALAAIQKASTTFSTDFSATINEVNKRLK